MGFSVDAETLSRLPHLLGRFGEDAAASRSYLLRHTQLRGGEGLFTLVLGRHKSVVEAVEHFFSDAEGSLAGTLAVAVQGAVSYYRRVDRDTSIAFDATIPGAIAPWMQNDRGSASAFIDRSEPQDALVIPSQVGLHVFQVKFQHLISIANLTRGIIWECTELATRFGICASPIDVYAECVRPMIGDWDGLRRCAEVFDRLGAAAVMMGANVGSAAVDVQGVWSGNAADGCRLLLHQIALALDSAATPLQNLAAEYLDAASKTAAAAEAIADLLAATADLGVLAIAESSAMQLTLPTVLIPVALSTKLVAALREIVNAIHRAIAVYESVRAVVQLFAETLDRFTMSDGSGAMPGLPRGIPLLPSASDKKPV